VSAASNTPPPMATSSVVKPDTGSENVKVKGTGDTAVCSVATVELTATVGCVVSNRNEIVSEPVSNKLPARSERHPASS
jgi:hypothetical protein